MQKNNKQVIKLAKGYLGQQLQQGFLTAAVGNTPYPVKLVVQASHCCSKKGKHPAGWMDITFPVRLIY